MADRQRKLCFLRPRLSVPGGREKERLVIAAWRNFADAADRYCAPPNATIETIQQAAELLGLEVKPS